MSRLGAFLVLAVLVASPTSARAADRTHVPLKNWEGFAIHRHQVYDDLERLVTAGLAGRTLLSTKPLSRVEAARIVARAIEAIRRDEQGRYDARRDLEPVLERLAREFRSELAALGVSWPGGEAPGTVAFVPVDRAQVRGGYASRAQSFVAGQGLRFQEGVNGGLTFDSRLQVGDVLSLYVQPELQANEEFTAARLLTGYAKLTLANVELFVGRDSLWWGPGLHGSLILSNNAPPLDHVRIGAAEPFLLPWIGEWLGPTKLLFFLAQLETRRDHPRAKLAGMRATIAPFPFLELGASRTVMFGGDTRPRPGLGDFATIIFKPEAGDLRAEPELRNNNLFAIDWDLRLADVDRYRVPARDLRLYGEFGWDDTCCETFFLPKREAASWLVGVHLLGALGREGLDVRVEYATTSSQSFVHDQFRTGYATRGRVISHFVGTAGRSLQTRVTNRLSPNLMLGAGLVRATVGSTVAQFPGRREQRTGGALDLSLRFWERYALFAEYHLTHVENRNFRRGDDGLDHLFRVELTRSFR